MKKLLLLLLILLAADSVSAGVFLGIKKPSEYISMPLYEPLDSAGMTRKPDSAQIFTYADNATATTFKTHSITYPFDDISIDTTKEYGDTLYFFVDQIQDIDGAGGNFTLTVLVRLWAAGKFFSDAVGIVQVIADSANTYWTKLDASISSRSTLAASDNIGINWADITNTTSTQNLSGTNISTTQSVASVSGAVGSVTGAVGSVTGNVGGNVVGTVSQVTGSVGSVTGNVTGSVGSIGTNGITASSFQANSIDSGAFAATTKRMIANHSDSSANQAIKVKTDFLPSATAGTAGGVFIAGTNAATTVTSGITGNLNGNVTGSVGSVTGNVNGSVGSVTGNIGGNVVGSVGSVVGSVGSVTGNVGGNVIGSVGSVIDTVKTPWTVAKRDSVLMVLGKVDNVNLTLQTLDSLMWMMGNSEASFTKSANNNDTDTLKFGFGNTLTHYRVYYHIGKYPGAMPDSTRTFKY